jgi:hypothetical protein
MNEYIVIYNLGEYHREWEQRLWLENNKGERGESEWLWFLFFSFLAILGFLELRAWSLQAALYYLNHTPKPFLHN